jgi:zinc-ribbon domain
MPAAPSCANCGSRLPKRSRFCPECGTRVGAGPGETAVQELPPQETGPVPVEVSVAAPRFFGVTPPSAVLALAAASLALAIVLFVSGHVIVGGALLGVAVVLAFFFVGLARRLPDAPVSRLSSGAVDALRARAGFAMEALSVHSGARVELFRLRRELADLLAQRAECARVLGEAVYADDEEGSESARSRMTELDGLVAAKEEEMEQTAAGAMERIQRAQLHVQPTQIETPQPVPEPYPQPSPVPEPVPIPEPGPEPSEPPGPAIVPEPSPAPSPPPQGE